MGSRNARLARAASIVLAIGSFFPARAHAQSAEHSRELSFSSGVTVLSDALGPQCGHDSFGGGFALGAALLQRLGHHVLAQVDTRLVNQEPFGCDKIGVPVDTAYQRSLARDPRITSTLRLGIETPASLPLFRLTAGIGADWGSPTLGVGALGLAWSSRGEHRRFFVQFDRLETRVHAVERHHALAPGASESSKAIVTYPTAHSLSIGLAFR